MNGGAREDEGAKVKGVGSGSMEDEGMGGESRKVKDVVNVSCNPGRVGGYGSSSYIRQKPFLA